MISFTVETDGFLPWDLTERSILAADAATGRSPAHYMVNCAHPTHIAPALCIEGPWIDRLGGIRANPPPKSHAELNKSTTLEQGDPDEVGALLSAMRRQHRHFTVMGGCCGSDGRHAGKIGFACLAVEPFKPPVRPVALGAKSSRTLPTFRNNRRAPPRIDHRTCSAATASPMHVNPLE